LLFLSYFPSRKGSDRIKPLCQYSVQKQIETNHRSSIASLKEVSVEAHVEKTRDKFMSRYQNAGNNHNKIANNYLENQANFKYLGATVSKQIAFTKKLR
jgi:hypothetical protein